jgi:CBS domain-containing protein
MLNQPIADVLAGKEIREVLSTLSTATVAEAAQLMSGKSVGAIVVRAGAGAVEGIFTERDLLRRVVAAGLDPRTTKMAQVMTRDVRTISAQATVEDALRLMVVHRYRHLLVQDGAGPIGLISVRDLMTWLVQPDSPIAHEGRVGVVRARMREAVESVSSGKP